MKRIVLQAGHQNIQSNIDPALRSGTGTAGEMELNVKMRDAVSALLVARGFQVFLTDANFNSDPSNSQDYDLFLALHGDANVYGTGGGCVSAPDPSVDSANTESQRIAKVFADTYFKEAGIINHPERINNNMTFYYMWQYLSAKTPCVLLEMGVVQDPHDSVLLADSNIISRAITKSICAAFNVPFDQAPPPPANPPHPIPPLPPSVPPQPPTTTPTVPPVQPPMGDTYKNYLLAIKGVLNNGYFFWKWFSDTRKIQNIINESGA